MRFSNRPELPPLNPNCVRGSGEKRERQTLSARRSALGPHADLQQQPRPACGDCRIEIEGPRPTPDVLRAPVEWRYPPQPPSWTVSSTARRGRLIQRRENYRSIARPCHRAHNAEVVVALSASAVACGYAGRYRPGARAMPERQNRPTRVIDAAQEVIHKRPRSLGRREGA